MITIEPHQPPGSVKVGTPRDLTLNPEFAVSLQKSEFSLETRDTRPGDYKTQKTQGHLSPFSCRKAQLILLGWSCG